MAELHESLVVALRKRIVREGYKESKSPMPTFRPDIFAEKTSRFGKILAQVAVEAEIPSTLYHEHTSHQLLKMDEFINYQRSRGMRVRGFLLVPQGKRLFAQAKGLLESLFPSGTNVKVLQGP